MMEWIEKILSTWIQTGQEAYLFLTLVIIALLSLTTVIIYLFKLYVIEKDNKVLLLQKQQSELKNLIKQYKEELKKQQEEYDDKVNKWIRKWEKKVEDSTQAMIENMKYFDHVTDTLEEQTKAIKNLSETIKGLQGRCLGGGICNDNKRPKRKENREPKEDKQTN